MHMAKKTAYQRPALAKAGAFEKVTAGTLFGCKKESFFSRPKFLCS
jgi:hypothetical protein